MLLDEIGVDGQARLAASSVLVVGCGALGAAGAELLTRAGVGHLRLADRDIIEESNLHRQLLYTEADAATSTPKALAAAEHLAGICSSTRLEAEVVDVGSTNIRRLIDGVDLVFDGTDNTETRYLINDAAVAAGVPWVYGGAVGTSGLVMPIVPGAGPCFRCVYPEPPPPGSLPTCDVAGVLGSLPVLVASLQATEAIRLLVGDRDAAGRMTSLDPWRGDWVRLDARRDPECPCCGLGRYDFLGGGRTSWTTALCGRGAVQVTPPDVPDLDLAVLADRLAAVGPARFTGAVVLATLEGHDVIVFSDGRMLVKGTGDASFARGLAARYLGL